MYIYPRFDESEITIDVDTEDFVKVIYSEREPDGCYQNQNIALISQMLPPGHICLKHMEMKRALISKKFIIPQYTAPQITILLFDCDEVRRRIDARHLKRTLWLENPRGLIRIAVAAAASEPFSSMEILVDGHRH